MKDVREKAASSLLFQIPETPMSKTDGAVVRRLTVDGTEPSISRIR